MIKYYPSDALERMEIDKVIDHVSRYCHASVSVQNFESQPYYINIDLLGHQLSLVDSYMAASLKGKTFPLQAFANLDQTFNMLGKDGFILSLDDVFQVSKVVRIMFQVYRFFTIETQEVYPLLWDEIKILPKPHAINSFLTKIVDEEGEIKPDASERLVEISNAISRCKKALGGAFLKELNKYKQREWLTDNYESVRNGRRVLAVKAEKKRQIKGFIHDESATGKTTFIEPMAVFEYHNELQEHKIEFRKEVQRILADTSMFLREELYSLKLFFEKSIFLDILQAKTRFAIEIKAIKPTLLAPINDQLQGLEINNGIHPLLEIKLRKEGKNAVPFSVYLNQKNRILLLSGPNAGGKSISLKAIGLFQLMLQKGLLLPCEPTSKMSIYEDIFVDIGDQQSLEEDLSTYSSHLNNMNYFMRNATDKSMILIDEFGSGTDPKIGGALAESILYALNKKKCFGAITTHYSNLKIFAFHTRGIVNAAMMFDKDTLSPSYKLKVGQPGSSFAYEIAQKSGIDEKVIKAAKKKTGKSQTRVEDLLVGLQQDKAQLESQLDEGKRKDQVLQDLIAQYDQLKTELDYNKRKFKVEKNEFKLLQLSKENKALESLIKDLKTKDNTEKAKEQLQKNKSARSEVSQELNSDIKLIYHKDIRIESAINVGDYVGMRNNGFEGEVIEINKKVAKLLVGDMQIDVPMIDLVKKGVPLSKKSKTRSRIDISKPDINFSSQIDIRGTKASESKDILRAYIDQALIHGVVQITILHGKGSGILRKAVRDVAKEYKSISDISHPPDNRGGNGISNVKFD